MEGIANFILLLSGALLFGGLAMTVMSIRDDEEEDEDE